MEVVLTFLGGGRSGFFSPDLIFGARRRKEVFLHRLCSSRRHRWGRSCLEEERQEQGGRRGPVRGLVLQGKGGGGCVRRPQGGAWAGVQGGGGDRDDGCEEAGARGTRCDRGARAIHP